MVALASSSPRRRELLKSLGVQCVQVAAHVDETQLPGETVSDYVLRVSNAKLSAGLAQPKSRGKLVVAGDTVVCLDGRVFGKPSDVDDAVAMLLELSGRDHHVYSAVVVGNVQRRDHRIVISTVKFVTISKLEAEAYWHTGEPADKAGAYAIQGLGAQFVAHLEGSHSAVTGLPLFETAQLLRGFGLDLLLPRH
ncbi:MAG: Maf family protein [Pseudomonadota bacterium]